jgi:cytochrome c
MDKKQSVVRHKSLSVIDSGRKLFEMNCSSCHAPQRTLVGPPFQRIREANGLAWSLAWVRNSQGMIKQRDTNALYIFYRWEMLVQVDFPSLSNKEIESIFDYVDSYPFDSVRYEHRKFTKLDRWKYIDSIDKARKDVWYPVGDTTRRTSRKSQKIRT